MIKIENLDKTRVPDRFWMESEDVKGNLTFEAGYYPKPLPLFNMTTPFANKVRILKGTDSTYRIMYEYNKTTNVWDYINKLVKNEN